jgi:hypothetical protein
VTVVAPTPTVVASHWLPLASLTVATAASVDVHRPWGSGPACSRPCRSRSPRTAASSPAEGWPH